MADPFVRRNISGTGNSVPDHPPPYSNPPKVNKLDDQIQRHNGSTSILEFSQQRLQLAKHKPIPNLFARVEELTRELGNLRQEIQFYRQCFESLQELRERTYDAYQQLFLCQNLDHDSERFKELITQLHHALENSVRQEVNAEKSWMEFWGINYDARKMDRKMWI